MTTSFEQIQSLKQCLLIDLGNWGENPNSDSESTLLELEALCDSVFYGVDFYNSVISNCRKYRQLSQKQAYCIAKMLVENGYDYIKLTLPNAITTVKDEEDTEEIYTVDNAYITVEDNEYFAETIDCDTRISINNAFISELAKFMPNNSNMSETREELEDNESILSELKPVSGQNFFETLS